jgi:hypothetical protein
VSLRQKIAKQLELIISSCRLFDAGNREEAIRIADAVRVILDRTPTKGRSLLHEYFGDRVIQLRSTTMLNSPTDSHFLGFMGLEANTGRFRPFLNDTRRDTLLPLNEWWDEPVIKLNEENETISRKEIILGALKKDGNVGTDRQTLENYQRLVMGLGLKALVRTVDGRQVAIVFENANLAALRQIGHELLTSADVKVVYPVIKGIASGSL